MIKISPSLLAADATKMGEEVKDRAVCRYAPCGCYGRTFCPNISFGIPFVADMSKATDITLDVHLMIEHPLSYIEKFAKAGSDIITVHIEVGQRCECIRLIKSLGKRRGCPKPEYRPKDIAHLVDSVDMVLQMTVFPGFGGQSMVRQALDNIKVIRDMIGEKDLQVDGGIYVENCHELVALGANVIVSGTGIFGQKDSVAAIKALKQRCMAEA